MKATATKKPKKEEKQRKDTMTTYKLMKQIVRREAYQLQENDYIAHCIKELKEDRRDLTGLELGYHTPSNANWSYHVELISYKGTTFEIIKRFGEIIHACYASVPNYEKKEA